MVLPYPNSVQVLWMEQPSVNLLVGFQEEGEAHLEVYETSRNQPGSYVDLNDVLHMGPSTVELGTEDMETELSEGAQGRRTMAHLTRARGSSSSTVRALVRPPGSGSSSFTVPSPSSSSSSWVGLKFVHRAEADQLKLDFRGDLTAKLSSLC